MVLFLLYTSKAIAWDRSSNFSAYFQTSKQLFNHYLDWVWLSVCEVSKVNLALQSLQMIVKQKVSWVWMVFWNSTLYMFSKSLIEKEKMNVRQCLVFLSSLSITNLSGNWVSMVEDLLLIDHWCHFPCKPELLTCCLPFVIAINWSALHYRSCLYSYYGPGIPGKGRCHIIGNMAKWNFFL